MPEAVTPPNPAGAGGTGEQPIQGGSRSTGETSETKPDPTLLTIDALRREIAMLESLFDTRLESARELTDAQLARHESLMEAAEQQRREQKIDAKAAIDDSLSAQRESTLKMERSISNQVASLKSQFETEIRSIRTGQDDLKQRMTTSESLQQGAMGQKEERREINAGVVAAVGLGISVLLALLALIGFVLSAGA